MQATDPSLYERVKASMGNLPSLLCESLLLVGDHISLMFVFNYDLICGYFSGQAILCNQTCMHHSPLANSP